MSKALKHRTEYVALRGLSFLLRALPYPGALRAAEALSFLFRPAASRRLREAERRIREMIGSNADPVELTRILRIAWRNLFFNAVEMARNDGCDAEWVRRHVTSEIPERIGPHLATGRGVIVALPHAGNWDLGGVVTRAAGVPIFSIARRQSNPLTDAWINRMRAASGMEMLANDGHLLRQVIRNLKKGMMLAMLPDVRVRTPSLSIRFLNGTANLGGGIALFARAASVPVFPLFVSRVGRDRHHLRVFDPIWPDSSLSREEDALRMTQAVVDAFQPLILEHPEQYFWFNKRWVLEPLAETDRVNTGSDRA